MDAEHDVFDIVPGDLIWDDAGGDNGMGIVIQHVPDQEFSIMWCDDLPHGGIRTYVLREREHNGGGRFSIRQYRWLGKMLRRSP